MIGFRPRDALFSLNSFMAMLLALFVAFSLDLPRPYWAMLTVYITVQPLSGALRSKAVYRVLGTILGGSAAVVLVPNLVNSPIALSLALAAWVGTCLYVSLLDRTPRSYVSLLAGYTAAIIGFSSVNTPGLIFETAVSRVEEIIVGILCAALVHSIIFPRSVTAVLAARVTKVLADVEKWSGKALIGRSDTATDQERRRLAGDVTELHILATHLPFDTTSLRPATSAIGVFEDRLAVALPLATGVEDRLIALKANSNLLTPELDEILSRTREWISAGMSGSLAEAERLEAACLAVQPEIDTRSAWSKLLTASAAERSRELIEALQDCRDLSRYIHMPAEGIPVRLDPLVHLRVRRPLHRDRGLAVLSSAAAAVAILFCCTAWIGLAWPEGATAATMAAVFSSFFATLDDPAPALVSFLTFTIISLPLAALYLFAILPSIDGFPMLALVLAPAFLVIGYLQADPRFTSRAMPLLIGVAGSLSLQETFTADFAGFLNANLALVLGITATLVITRLFRSVGADWSARRILIAGWQEMSRVSVPGGRPDRIAWTSLMLDRLGLLTPRLALIKHPELSDADALNDLRIGLNIIDLQYASHVVERGTRETITKLLQSLSEYFAKLRPGLRLPGSISQILPELDQALASLSAAVQTPERYRGLVALAGLRRNLFPNAPPYEALEPIVGASL